LLVVLASTDRPIPLYAWERLALPCAIRHGDALAKEAGRTDQERFGERLGGRYGITVGWSVAKFVEGAWIT